MEKNLNKKYNLEIEVLTPLSIGVGAEKDLKKGVDFVVKEGRMYRLSLKKMQNAGINIDKISNLIAWKNEKGLLSELANKLEEASDLIKKYPTESGNPVKATLKNELTGDALIAGSSLKGAVRSALYKYLGADKEEAVAFGDMKEGTNIMRFMKFSDADFKETELVNSKIFNLWKDRVREWQGGWKNGMNNTSYNCSNNEFNTLYECIMPGEKGYGTLMLSATSYDLCERNAKSGLNTRIQPLLSKDLQSGLFEKINGYTKTYLLKEKAFYNKYSNNVDNADKILDSIDYLLEQIPDDNSSCVMKMSAGVGFHSVTGDWQFNDFSINGLDDRGNVSRGLLDGKPSAKSRKLAIYGNRVSPMGFVKIREIDAAEQFEVEKNRQKR